jgi:hypothetical protein
MLRKAPSPGYRCLPGTVEYTAVAGAWSLARRKYLFSSHNFRRLGSGPKAAESKGCTEQSAIEET